MRSRSLGWSLVLGVIFIALSVFFIFNMKEDFNPYIRDVVDDYSYDNGDIMLEGKMIIDEPAISSEESGGEDAPVSCVYVERSEWLEKMDVLRKANLEGSYGPLIDHMLSHGDAEYCHPDSGASFRLFSLALAKMPANKLNEILSLGFVIQPKDYLLLVNRPDADVVIRDLVQRGYPFSREEGFFLVHSALKNGNVSLATLFIESVSFSDISSYERSRLIDVIMKSSSMNELEKINIFQMLMAKGLEMSPEEAAAVNSWLEKGGGVPVREH